MDCSMPGLRPPPTPRVYPNSCPLSQWCHPTISSSVIPFSSHLQSFPASGSFPMSQFFTSGCQSSGVSVSTSVLPMKDRYLFLSPLGWTGWISLQSKGLSRLFSIPNFQATIWAQRVWDLARAIWQRHSEKLGFSPLFSSAPWLPWQELTRIVSRLWRIHLQSPSPCSPRNTRSAQLDEVKVVREGWNTLAESTLGRGWARKHGSSSRLCH